MESEPKVQFKVGDIVEAFGVRGWVTDITKSFVHVAFNNAAADSFFSDGRQRGWHAAPSLKLIERPRKTKKVKVWVNVYPSSAHDTRPWLSCHIDENDARDYRDSTGITQQIEVEVIDE